MFYSEQSHLVELVPKHRLPTVCSCREYVDAGGLLSYGPNIADMFRRAATYVDKILKGARPADLAALPAFITQLTRGALPAW